MISVVIPTYNRNELLKKCLDALHPDIQKYDLDYKVIVTDDTKEQTARQLIETVYTWVHYVEGPHKGPAANRNNGARYANNEWLLFIDDDCVPDSIIMNEYLHAIKTHKDLEAFEGKIYVDEQQTSFLQEAPINMVGGYFWSCNICIKKTLFEKLNGFDEGFPYAAMEDVDFFLRLKKITQQYMFLPNAAVMHPWRINRNMYNDIKKRYISQLYYLKKNPEESKNISATGYIRSFINFFTATLKNSFKYRFRGFFTKVKCDFLQLRFAFKTLFN